MVMNDMTHDGKWGAVIPIVDGKRPEWLEDNEVITGVYPADFYIKPGTVDPAKSWAWNRVISIRLPADHPHYRQTQTQTLTAQERLERMEALCRALSEVPRDSVLGQSGYASEARALVAEMEPVDPEQVLLEETAKAIYESYEYVKPWDHPDTVRIHHDHTRKAAAAAIKRGRELARGDVA